VAFAKNRPGVTGQDDGVLHAGGAGADDPWPTIDSSTGVPGFSLEQAGDGGLAPGSTWRPSAAIHDDDAEVRTIGVMAGGKAMVFPVTRRRRSRDRVARPGRAGRGAAVRLRPHEALLKPLLGITDDKLDARTQRGLHADQAAAVARRPRGPPVRRHSDRAERPAAELSAVVNARVSSLPQKSTALLSEGC